MTAGVKNTYSTIASEASVPYNFWQRAVLRKSHPLAVIFNSVGGMWAVFGLWRNDILVCLGALIFTKLLAVSFTQHVDYQALAQTIWGKLALLHLHPINLMAQLLGVVLAVVGLWEHNTVAILSAISLIMLGHAYGWYEVHSSLRLRN